MNRILIVGNSGSGKSTLAKRLAEGSAHLDLDTLAWLPDVTRRPLDESGKDIDAFVGTRPRWVIEGCYADLVEMCLPTCTELLFLDPGVEACLANARARPWEPHKYATKEAQDKNLEMLLGWIRDYDVRGDACSRAAHERVFAGFSGSKVKLASRDAIASFRVVR
jgi:adenylate kinase family enzyme